MGRRPFWRLDGMPELICYLLIVLILLGGTAWVVFW